MCGIVGGFGNDINEMWVESETEHLKRRGPDHQAILKVNQFLTMGAARLAMTDPKPRSNQPFRRKEYGASIVFNGEIYNYLELRSELQARGLDFITESDTEVLLLALQEFGTSATSRINGMYAFAFYSEDSDELILCRDKYGKKPLYYLIIGATFYWSSSLQSLRKLQKNSTFSIDGLIQYLCFGYTIDSETIESDIRALAPGTIARITYENGAIKYSIEVAQEYAPQNDGTPPSIRGTIKEAVVARISGHETAAISLSGGLDSSIIALLASQTETKITAFSATWPDSDKARYNTDAETAKTIADKLGINFRSVPMTSTAALESNLDEFVVAMEEPNSNPSGVSMISLYKEIAQDGHRLVLTGDGADEIFGGYPRYESINRLPQFLKLRGDFVHSVASKARDTNVRKPINLLISQIDPRSFHRWAHWHWNFTPEEVTKIFVPANGVHDTQLRLGRAIERVSSPVSSNSVERLMEMDRLIWLTMESNRKLDRISMFNSIEARSPFQDENVIQSALHEMKKHGFKKLEKLLLWSEFPEISTLGVRNDKAGFISPVGHWLRHNPTLAENSIEHLAGTGLFNLNYMKTLLVAPMEGNYRKIMQLWSLVVLSKWLLTRA
jgi:asparagine synthase (glutamine-hydrolysing)